MQLCNSLLTFSDYRISVCFESLGMRCLDLINRASENSFFSLYICDRWKQYEAYVQALEGKYTDLNCKLAKFQNGADYQNVYSRVIK